MNSEINNNQAVLEEFDKDSAGRKLKGYKKKFYDICFIIYAVAVIIFALVYKTATPYTKLPIFVGMSLFIGYLKYPFNKKEAKKINYLPIYDIALGVISLVSYSLYAIRQNDIAMMGGKIGTFEIVIAIVCIALLVELARRAVGIPILVIAGAFVIYGVIWRYNINPKTVLMKMMYDLYYNIDCGIFSSPIAVCSSFIILFIILGSFLEKTGIGTFFVDLANSVVGTAAGGPAKVAVIASALTGMYSGSSVANTVSSGSITIPMMKKTGYKPEFAGAVEAAASTGGQIMPPIMGAAAFLMAEITGYSYFTIVLAAILPAVLYFLGIFLMVHFEAKRLGLKGLPKDAVPNFFKLIAKNGYLLLPVVVLVICMNFFTSGLSASMAILTAIIVSLIDKVAFKKLFKGEAKGMDYVRMILPLIPTAVLIVGAFILKLDLGYMIFASMIVCFAVSFLSKDATIKPKVILDGLAGGTNSSIGVVAACGIAGIISGVVSMTGLGSTLINVIVPLAKNGPIIALFLIMLCCIVLGMGVPTTANYVIMATITAPILVKMGIPVLAANMFVFYFGIVADITPPVALAAFAGSAIAKSNPLKTGFIATKLAIAAFIVPYLFALNPDMLLVLPGTSIVSIIQIVFTSIVGLFGIAAGFEGYAIKKASWVERIIFLIGGLALIVPELITDIIGIVLVVGVVIYQIISLKTKKIA